jgi:hypothetical protein
MHLYGGNRESLTRALDRIQRAASLVLCALTALPPTRAFFTTM